MNAEQAWQATLGQLQMEMSKPAYDTWVRDACLLSCEGENIIVGVKNAYICDWLETRLIDTITRKVTALMERPMLVHFIVNTKDQSSEQENPDTVLTQRVQINPCNHNTLNGRYTFSEFVVAGNNRLAHAAALSVVENPSHSYNPLFIYGDVGLGKTHLLQAIGHAIQEAGRRVLFVTSEEFTNDLICAIMGHSTTEFREKFRTIDVLLVDDIQFIAGKDSTQEEFFHTFNALHDQGKQIVITSDRPPRAIGTLELRLRSRFEWGLIADLQPPDYETRIAILNRKTERMGRLIPDEVIDLIARCIQNNIRELEGALNRLCAYADLIGAVIDQALAKTALSDYITQQQSVNPEHIMGVVANAFGVEMDRLVGRERTQDIALPRQVAMYLLREETHQSLPQIGQTLGGRDHTTVMYACDKVAGLIENDDRVRSRIIAIREQLYARASLPV
ncbi:MAG: chromosomal replication initiator protein DnaA [Anaerolineaceae bacterium]|nr:chromosomal replication initiator protein DnaA [Anaerolineaceae bacterium]MBN2677115.1 chromosomal replication initiator protein DnaA [Anaerolineaceae bacterium]